MPDALCGLAHDLELGSVPPLRMGRQHERRPHLLANALTAARDAAPHLDGLARRMLPAMPRQPRASQNLRSIARVRGTSPMLLDEAVTCPWVAVDSADVRNAILLDGDHDDWLDRWLALPEDLRPDLIVDPWSGRFHAVLILADPVPTTAAARMGPQLMADLAGRLLAAAMGATLLPPGSLIKSPWGQTRHLVGIRRRLDPRPACPELWEAAEARGLMWHTVEGSGAADLRAIVAALAPSYWNETDRPASRYARARGKPARGEPSVLGRHCALFDLARWWAYDREERDAGRIADECAAIDARMRWGLPASDISSTARSIATFMNTRYRPRTRLDDRRGRDRSLVAGLPLDEAQAVAARETNKARRMSTETRLRDGLVRLREANAPLTQAALAAASGLSLRTVKSRWRASPQKVQDGGVSGNAGCRPAQPLQAASSKILESSSFATLSWCGREEARRAASVAAQVACFDRLAQRMMRRGAPTLALPVVASSAPQVVRNAQKKALAAWKDAARRRDARRNRRIALVASEARRADFRRWAEAKSPVSFDSFMVTEAQRWDKLDLAFDGKDRFARERYFMRRAIAFRRYRKEWEEAVRAASQISMSRSLFGAWSES